jgi:hypothetical protein
MVFPLFLKLLVFYCLDAKLLVFVVLIMSTNYLNFLFCSFCSLYLVTKEELLKLWISQEDDQEVAAQGGG